MGLSPHIRIHMQIKRGTNGKVQQWINEVLVSEWGDAATPLPNKEETRRLLQSAINAFGRGRLHVDLSSNPKGDPK